jgi:two-component system, cell cycle sensor histidine kinase and response regulator CckA
MEILLVGLGGATSGVVDRVLATRGHTQTLAVAGADALLVLRGRGCPFVVVEDPLSDMTAAEFCRRARVTQHGPDAVILVLTHRDEDLFPVLEAGATDLYTTSLGPSGLETRLLIAERLVAKQAELRAREARFRRLFESGVAGVTIADLDGNFKDANHAFLDMLGYTHDELLAGKLSWAVITPPDCLVPDTEAREQLRSTGFLPLREREYVHKDGHHISALVGAAMLADTGEFVTYVTDLTERKVAERAVRTLEEQLRQAQKLEAIGLLAGGVAHDFNNLLSIILSYSGLALEELGVDDALRPDLQEIQRAGERASELTRQLLAFSRQQILLPKVLDLNLVVAGMQKMLGQLLRADIALSILPCAELGMVHADPGEIERVVMNLVINARDAMPTGGKLTIETANVELDAAYAADHHGVIPGPYVLLAIADTGVGMDSATRGRMFEPFFTTKERGKGTGLGLSTLFGIVKQSGGHVWVYSERDHGTTFKVYFPRNDQPLGADDALSVGPVTSQGSETILVAEDDEPVRNLTCLVLRRSGYQVLEARDGVDALLVAEQHEGPIQLLLTDVVMPQMGGRLLAERLALLRPDIRTLYMSGYTDDAIVHHGVLEGRMAFAQKPITPPTLLRKVRALLDARHANPAGHNAAQPRAAPDAKN